MERSELSHAPTADETPEFVRRQAAIFEAALDCIITIDEAGRIVEFNPAAERTFGYPRDRAIGVELANLIVPPALRDRHRAGLTRFLQTGRSSIIGRRIEMSAVNADGHEFPVEIAITQLPGAGPPRFTAFMRDVSDRKRIDQQRSARLAVSQVLAQAASVEEASTGILRAVCETLEWETGCVWMLNSEGAALTCVECWRRSPSRTGEFERASRSRVFPSGVGLPGRVWSTGASAWIPDVTRDQNFPRGPIAASVGLRAAFGCPIVLGGTIIGVIEFFSRHIREPDANLLEMMTNICSQFAHYVERRRAERALQQSEQRFSRFMQHLPGLAWIKDLEGRYVYVNDSAEQAFRTPRAELIGKTDRQVFSESTAAAFQENDARALASGTGAQVIETLEDANGVVRHSIVSKFPIFNADNQPTLVGGMAIDITDRLRAEDALREADRRKDEFLAMLAHELRNPLAPIRNALQILQMPNVDSQNAARMTSIIGRQVDHLVRLVDDLLDVSRVMRGRIELRIERVELASVVARAVEIVRPLIDARQHSLKVTLPEASLLVEVDPVRMAQVLANLLTNAGKYMDDGGSIWLDAVRDHTSAVIRVIDRGIGIPADLLPHVFELFVQADHSQTRAQGGLGIGLTLVRNLVELHGGTVEAHSAGAGQGSEFVMRIPCVSPNTVQPFTAPTGAAVDVRAQQLLVVDDNRDAATTLAVLLRLRGHTVRIANDGPAALASIAEAQPDVIFLDIGMPGMDGYEVARRIRMQPDLRQVRLVALTGWGQEEDRRRSMEAGFDFHLVKPPRIFEIEAVLKAIA